MVMRTLATYGNLEPNSNNSRSSVASPVLNSRRPNAVVGTCFLALDAVNTSKDGALQTIILGFTKRPLTLYPSKSQPIDDVFQKFVPSTKRA